jgi:hypothetical protein
MKQVFFILALLSGTVFSAKAQDTIVRTNGNKIPAQVMEIGLDNVKYQLYNDNSKQSRFLKKSDIFKIKYANGTETIITNIKDTQPSQTYKPSVNPEKRNKKGYAGISVGGAMMLTEYADLDKIGMQFNVNCGYLFTKHIGITASFLYTSYKFTDDKDSGAGLRGGLVGPLISFGNSSQKLEYDIRPTVGVISGKVKKDGESVDVGKMTFGAGLGGTIRWNVSSLISLTGNLDSYFHGTFDELESLASVGITAGINFRF